jgi:outer membrane protein OmpA-like peptidoglycan-associated protein
MKLTKFIAAMVCVLMGLSFVSEAHAHKKLQEVTRYDVMTNKKLISRLNEREVMALHRYFDYEEREPCQKYDHIDFLPKGFVQKDCALWTQHYKKVNYKEATVHFASASAKLSASEKAKVHKMAHKAQKSKSGKVVLKGFTDSVGNKMANEKLSKQRVAAVKRIFLEHGVADRMITTSYHGEAMQAMKTGDGVSSRSNRRVEMKVFK